MNSVRTLILVPAYNASVTIGELLRRLQDASPDADILVIDDGSIDDTAEVVRTSGVRLISHETNEGKGAAIKTGLDYAFENGFDGLLTIDADLQHDPEYVQKILELASSGDFDMIIGARKRTFRMPRHRALSNFVTSLFVSLLSGVCIRDTQSGYRWMRTEAIRNLRTHGTRYDYESEILMRAGKSGLRIGEIRVPTIYKDETSSINPFRDSWRFIGILARSFFW